MAEWCPPNGTGEGWQERPPILTVQIELGVLFMTEDSSRSRHRCARESNTGGDTIEATTVYRLFLLFVTMHELNDIGEREEKPMVKQHHGP